MRQPSGRSILVARARSPIGSRRQRTNSAARTLMSASAACTHSNTSPRILLRTGTGSCSSWAHSSVRTPWPVGAPSGPQHPTSTVDEHLPWMRTRAADIQAAMGVLGHLPPSHDEPVISLSRVDLRSIPLRDARLSRSRFRYAHDGREPGAKWPHTRIFSWPLAIILRRPP